MEELQELKRKMEMRGEGLVDRLVKCGLEEERGIHCGSLEIESQLTFKVEREGDEAHPVSALQIRTVESREPVTTRIPSNATA